MQILYFRIFVTSSYTKESLMRVVGLFQVCVLNRYPSPRK